MKTGTLYINLQTEDSICLQVVDKHLTGILKGENSSDLYIGRIMSINGSLNAAFLDIGEEKNGFLPLSKGHGLKCGQCLLVSKTKEPRGDKGAQVTDKVTLGGNLLCLLPMEKGCMVSSKITDSEQIAQLKEHGNQIISELGGDFGIIMRTMSVESSYEVLLTEAKKLLDTWQEAKAKIDKSAVPGSVDNQTSFCDKILKTMVTPEIQEIIVDDHDAYCYLSDCINKYFQGKISVKKYDQEYKMLEYYNLNALMRHSLGHKVLLPSGGSIVIDKTEAMTVIDVNSGKGSLSPQMVIKTNLEACKEIAAQLRLRNLGGIIVVDFINMDRSLEDQVLTALKEETAVDRAVTGIFGFSKLGLVEIARSRVLR